MAKKGSKVNVPESAETPISSMIDIVFLLIIFFVVTASVDKEIEDEKIMLAEAPHGRPVTKKDPRSITINVRQDGTITMGMHEVSETEISNVLEDAKTRMSADDIPIIIRGDYNTQHHHIKRVMDAVTKTGLYKVRFNAQMETN